MKDIYRRKDLTRTLITWINKKILPIHPNLHPPPPPLLKIFWTRARRCLSTETIGYQTNLPTGACGTFPLSRTLNLVVCLFRWLKQIPESNFFSLYITRLYAVNWLFWKKKKDHWITRQFMKEGADVIWKSSPQAPELQVRWPRGAFNRCLKRSNITVSSYKYNNIL